MNKLGALLIAGALVFPCIAGADEYGRGFCAGRTAAFEQASTYVHTTFDEATKALPADDPVPQFLEWLFQVVPMVSFGPPLHEPIVVTQADGTRIQCPTGEAVVNETPGAREDKTK